jgi:hypothetical protein
MRLEELGQLIKKLMASSGLEPVTNYLQMPANFCYNQEACTSESHFTMAS